jgi:hypothetical protein
MPPSQIDDDPDRSARKYYSMSGHPGQYQYGALAGNYGRHDLDIKVAGQGRTYPAAFRYDFPEQLFEMINTPSLRTFYPQISFVNIGYVVVEM